MPKMRAAAAAVDNCLTSPRELIGTCSMEVNQIIYIELEYSYLPVSIMERPNQIVIRAEHHLHSCAADWSTFDKSFFMVQVITAG